MTLKHVKRIEAVIVHKEVDIDPNTEDFGQYTDKLEDGVIVRHFEEFYEKLTEEQKEEIPERGREYRYFKPFAAGVKVGTEDYYTYGKQDYEQMESYNRQEWYFMGIWAEARIWLSVDGGKSWGTQSVRAAGCWGIESDSDKAFQKEIEKESLDELKDYLSVLGFGRTVIAKAFQEITYKE